MSKWTAFRNAVETVFTPEINAAAVLGETVVNDSEASAGGNITKAFSDATTAFSVTPGGLEAKAIAAGIAFVTALVGYEVAIIKKDVAAEITAPVA